MRRDERRERGLEQTVRRSRREGGAFEHRCRQVVNGPVGPLGILFGCFCFPSKNKHDHQMRTKGWGTPISLKNKV